MHTTLKFFIVGAIIGLIIGLAPYPSEIQYDGDPEKYLKQVFSGTIKTNKFFQVQLRLHKLFLS